MLCSGLLLWLATSGAAEPLPQLEAGVGVIGLTRPDYRGSDHYSTSALPIPYAIYRGERLKISRDGVKLRLFNLDNLSVGLSSALSLAGRNDDPARAGMPDLRTTLEVGPSLDWRVYADQYAWCICTPVRFVTATNLRHFNAAGWVVHPQFELVRARALGDWTLSSSFSLGPVWADRKYHAYFYEVQPQFATADRPAYTASGGYSGTRGSIYVGVNKGRWRGGIGLLSDWLAGATFLDSPLVKTRTATVVGIGLSYQLWSHGTTGASDESP